MLNYFVFIIDKNNLKLRHQIDFKNEQHLAVIFAYGFNIRQAYDVEDPRVIGLVASSYNEAIENYKHFFIKSKY